MTPRLASATAACPTMPFAFGIGDGLSARSSTTTLMPRPASSPASKRPTGPAPQIATSHTPAASS